MFEEIRRAVLAAPRMALAELAGATWRAFAAGAVDDVEAQQLAELIEARKATRQLGGISPQLASKNGTSRRAPRPRSPASVERRRRWVASGWLPPQLAARFTPAETAALAVVTAEVRRAGACMLPLDGIAGRAGVSRSTVRNAMAQARKLGLITVEERRASAWRSLPNVVRIVSPEWRTWLARRASSGAACQVRATDCVTGIRGEGAKTCAPQSTKIYRRPAGGHTTCRPARPPAVFRRGTRGPGARPEPFA